MNQVPRHDQCMLVFSKGDCKVVYCMTRGWEHANKIIELIVAVDQIHFVLLNDWKDAIGKRIVGFYKMVLLPKFKFFFRQQIPSIWKRWRPLTVDQGGVPADVIRVQVCTAHVIDVGWRDLYSL